MAYRFMGDAQPVNPFPQLPSGGLTPAQIAPMLTPEQSTFLSDIVDETAVGKKKRLLHFGIAGAAGIALGFIASKVL